MNTKFEKNRLSYGIDYYRDSVQSKYWDYDSVTGVRSENVLKSTFPDGSRYETLGVFVLDEWKVTDNFSVSPEARYSRIDYGSTIRGNPVIGNIGGTFQNVTGGIGAVYGLAGGINLCLNLSQGFRAPNLDDLATLRVENQGIDVPNFDLRPEKNTNIEAGFKGVSERLDWSLSYYFCDVSDKIDRKPGSFEGATVIDGKPVYQKFNIGKAQIQGAEIGGRFYFDEKYDWSVKGNMAWTEGRNLTDAEPLSRIPPLNGNIGVKYEVKEYSVEMLSRFAGKQDNLSTRDRTDSRMDPNGTPAWITWNIRGDIKVTSDIKLSAGVDNIFDAAYRIHSSGVDSSGINVFSSIEIKY
jgi:outer membrane receptor protein involved in Fe transport